MLEPISAPTRSSDQNSLNSFEKLGKFMKKKLKKESLVGRHVSWLGQADSAAAAIVKGFLAGLEVGGLAVSIVGIPFIFMGVSASSKFSKYRELRKYEGGKDLEPPELDTVPAREINSMSFNHTHDFCLKESILWVKPKKIGERETDRKDWKLLYYDGYIKGKTPKQLSADGANLGVMDNERVIHYKKILDESRDHFLCWSGKYRSVSLVDKDNYEDAWFSLPVVSTFYNLFHDKNLKIPANSMWSMSHRGLFVEEFTDKAGYRHKEFSMTTTVHAAKVDEEEIDYADPYWCTMFEGNKIKLPKGFKLISLSSSAGTLFAYGIIKNERKFLISQDGDFDKAGRNCFLPGFWSSDLRADPRWVEHPDVTFNGKGSHTGIVTLYQKGVGDDQRKMNVIGVGPNGEEGVYEKWITEMKTENWRFIPVKTTFKGQAEIPGKGKQVTVSDDIEHI